MDDRHPRRIGTLVDQLMARRGYASVFANEDLLSLLTDELGTDLASAIHIGPVKSGVLQLFASDSVTLQELTFRKRGIVKRIQKDLPAHRVVDVRFRIQSA